MIREIILQFTLLISIKSVILVSIYALYSSLWLSYPLILACNVTRRYCKIIVQTEYERPWIYSHLIKVFCKSKYNLKVHNGKKLCEKIIENSHLNCYWQVFKPFTRNALVKALGETFNRQWCAGITRYKSRNVYNIKYLYPLYKDASHKLKTTYKMKYLRMVLLCLVLKCH